MSARKHVRSRFKTEASPDDADRTFPVRHHPIIIQELNTKYNNWQENAISDIGRCNAATDTFPPTLRNFFYKRWPTIFFHDRGCFFVRCCRKNLRCRPAGSFRSSSTEVAFRPTPACFHFARKGKHLPTSAKKHDSPILIEKHASRRRPGKMTDRFLKKKHHRMTPIEHFLIDLIQLLVRDWMENTIADIGLCKAVTDIFQSTLCNFFYKLLVDNIFLRYRILFWWVWP